MSSEEPTDLFPDIDTYMVGSSELQQRVLLLESHVNQKQASIESLTARQNQLEALLSQTEDDTDVLRSENCNLKTHVASLSATNQSNIRFAQAALEKLRHSLQILGIHDQMSGAAPLSPDRLNDIPSISAQLQSLIKSLCDRCQSIQHTERILEEQWSLRQLAIQKNVTLHDTLVAKGKEVEETRVWAEKAERDNFTLRTSVEKLQMENSATRQTLPETQGMMKAKEESFKTILLEKEKEIAVLKAEVSEASLNLKRTDELTVSLEKSRSESQELQFNLDSVQRLHESRMSSVVKANEALEQETHDLREQLKAESDSHMTELRKTKHFYQENILEMNNQKVHLGAVISALKSDNAALVDAAKMTVKDLESRLSQCEQKLHCGADVINGLEAQLRAVLAELKNNGLEMKNLNAENQWLRDQLATTSKVNDEVRCELENAKSQANAIKQENSKLRGYVSDQEAGNRKCSEKLESALQDVTTSQQEIDLLIRFHSARDKHLQADITHNVDIKNTVLKAFREQKVHMRNLKQLLDEAITDCTNTKERLTSMSNIHDAEIQSLKTQLESATSNEGKERLNNVFLRIRNDEMSKEILGLSLSLFKKENLCTELADELEIANSESAQSVSELLSERSTTNSLRLKHADEVVKVSQLESELQDVHLRCEALVKEVESFKDIEKDNKVLLSRLQIIEKTLQAKTEELEMEVENGNKITEKYEKSNTRVKELTDSLNESNDLIKKMQDAAKKSMAALEKSCKGDVQRAMNAAEKMRALQKQADNDLRNFVYTLDQVKASMMSDNSDNESLLSAVDETLSTCSLVTHASESMDFIIKQSKELRKVNESLIDLEEQSNQLAEENTILQSEIRAVGSSLSETENELRCRVQKETDMEMKINHYKDLLSDITNQLQEKEGCTEASDACKEAFLIQEKSRYTESFEQSTREINDLGNMLSEALSANASLKNELCSISEMHERTVAKLTDELEQISKDKETLENEVVRHRLESDSFRENLIKLLSKSDTVISEDSSMSSKELGPTPQLALVAKTLDELALSKKSLQNELEVMRQELIEKSEAFSVVDLEKKELNLTVEKTQSELVSAQNEVSRLVKSIDELQGELSQTSKSLDEEVTKSELLTRRLEHTLASSESRHEQDTNALSKANSENTTLRNKLENVDSIISELLVKFHDVVQESAGVKKLCFDTSQKFELVSGREKDLTRSLANLRSSSESTVELLEDSSREVNKLRAINDELSAKNAECVVTIRTRETELEESRGNAESLLSKIEQLQQESDASMIRFKGDLNSLQESLDSTHQKNVIQIQAEAETKLQSLEERLRRQMIESKTEMERTLENLRTIASEISDLRSDSSQPESIVEYVTTAFKSLKSSLVEREGKLHEVELEHQNVCNELAEVRLASANNLIQHEKEMSSLHDSHSAAISRLESEAKKELETALSEFSQLRSTLEEKNQNLSNKVRGLEEDVNKARSDLKDQISLIEAMQGEKKKVSEDVRKLEEECDILNSKLADFNRHHDVDMATICGLNSKLDDVQQELRNANTRASEAQAQAETDAAQLADEVKHLKSTVEDGVRLLSEKDVQVKLLKAEKEKLEVQGAKLDTKYEEAKQEIHRITSELNTEKQACERLSKEHENQLSKLRSSLADQHTSELTKAKEDAGTHLKDVASRAEERLEAMKLEISNLCEEKQRLQEDYSRLSATTNADQEKLKSDLKMLRERLDQATHAHESVLNAKNEAELQLVGERRSIDQMQQKMDELCDDIRGKVRNEQTQKEKVDALLQSVEALESGKRGLELELNETASALREELQHSNHVLVHLREQLASAQQECAEHQSSAIAHKAAGEALHTKLQKISEDHRAELAKENATAESLQQEHRRLLMNLDTKSRDHEELTRKVQELEISLQSSDSRCRNAELLLAEEAKNRKLDETKLRDEVKNVREQLQDALEKHELAVSERNLIRDQKEKLDRDVIPPLHAQVEHASLEIDRLSRMIQEKETEIKELVIQAAKEDQLRSDLEKNQSEVQEHIKQVAELEDTLKERNSCITRLEGIATTKADDDENYAECKETMKRLEVEVTTLRAECQEMEASVMAYQCLKKKNVACLRKLKFRKRGYGHVRKQQVTDENVKNEVSVRSRKRRTASTAILDADQSPLLKKTKTQYTSHDMTLSMRRGPMADLTQSHLNR